MNNKRSESCDIGHESTAGCATPYISKTPYIAGLSVTMVSVVPVAHTLFQRV